MIYTKSGDDGTTSLVGGTRVGKDDIRVEAYGTVDELNSHLGMLAEMTYSKSTNLEINFVAREFFSSSHMQLKEIQNKLFVIQTLLATEKEDIHATLPQIDQTDVARLEEWIDKMEKQLPRLSSFVIPGGSTENAQAHIARTVCRRAERQTVRLAHTAQVDNVIMHYLNRLSDYLFVSARMYVVVEGRKEIYWSAK